MKTNDKNKPQRTLLNFIITENLKESFDSVCRNQGATRTAILKTLMSQYVKEQSPKIQARQKAAQQPKPLGTTIESRKEFFGYGDRW